MLRKMKKARLPSPSLHYVSIFLEFRVLWCSWERYHVPDVLHTRHEKNQTLEAKTEASVRTASELARVEIPLVCIQLHSSRLYLVSQLLIRLFTHTSATYRFSAFLFFKCTFRFGDYRKNAEK